MAGDVRGAVIGCGFFAHNHLNAWRDLGVGIAVCDRDEVKVRDAAERFGARAWYTDAAEMYEKEQLDFVDIVTTMPSHRALVGLALGRKVPVIVQKPFAPSWDDCIAMVQEARTAGVPLMVHENFRFQAPMLRAAEIIASGEIGEPTWAHISFRTNHDVYANQPYLADEDELILLDLGIHLFDLARVFMGEVETVSCQTQRVNPKVRAEDQATALLRHVGGAVSVVDCSFESRREIEVFPQTLLHAEGRQGSVSVAPDFAMTVVSEGRIRKERPAPQPRPWASGPALVVQDSVVSACAHWLDCIASGIDAATSGLDNLRTYALVEAAYEAARSGAAVRPRTWAPTETHPQARAIAS
jgi:predicted dehydrogenase